MTTRYTLNPEVREKIPAEFLERWAEALLTSKQHRAKPNTNGMCNKDDTAHCCLCVAARLEGATFDDYNGLDWPSEMGISRYDEKCGISQSLSDIKAAEFDGGFRDFDQLNDRYMTHPQISHLITHGWVEV